MNAKIPRKYTENQRHHFAFVAGCRAVPSGPVNVCVRVCICIHVVNDVGCWYGTGGVFGCWYCTEGMFCGGTAVCACCAPTGSGSLASWAGLPQLGQKFPVNS